MKQLQLSIAGLMLAGSVMAQTAASHAIFVNGGVYGSPGTTSIASYNIAENTVAVIDSPMTSTVQALLVDGTTAYVAADDSLFAYDLVSNTRIGAVNHKLDYSSEDGLAKDLLMLDGKLLMSKQFPATKDFVDIIDPSDLSYVGSVDSIVAETADIVVLGDSLYIATPGGWGAEEGNVSVVSLDDMTVKRTIALGADAKGMGNICSVNDKLYGFISASSDYETGETFPGKIAIIDPTANSEEYIEVPDLGSGYSSASNIIGIDGDAIFFRDSGNIATFNTVDNSITDVVTGLENLQAGVFDPVADKLFVLTGDFSSDNGKGYVFNANDGTQLAVFDSVKASPEQIALFPVPVEAVVIDDPSTNLQEVAQLSVYPNPANTTISIDGVSSAEITIYSSAGSPVFFEIGTMFDISSLPSGMYTIQIVVGGTISVQSLVIQ